ncbi:hypothetical protein IW261DRAFT_1550776 [Armillaria novae-zelandiae]|uniref:Uncharacterized protein n=1 Tax=Armillaria novae-zelandiae TaxID=153914 RepID=A0AA39PCJ5_9AGAR|nr:hypothetical protein IW261DRAFT_1550776 [Armillaria novae-zelandiae]
MATYTEHLPSPTLSDVSAHSDQEYPPVQESDLPARHHERRLGDTEASYFLPSRESGVNDMYLHLGFNAPTQYVRRSRVRLVWAILRVRHPLLASRVQVHDYDDIRFVYIAPASVEEALNDADRNLETRSAVKDELIDPYLNGPRTLSADRLSFLIISSVDEGSSLPSPPSTPIPSTTAPHGTNASVNYDILICATHFLGDGMALHQFANDFFSLLGSSKDEKELEGVLRTEWETRCNKSDDLITRFTTSRRLIKGGHTFPRRSGQPRRTIVPTISIDAERTKKMLKTCKAHGVSISSAYFALCNIAWARNHGFEVGSSLRKMMYSALNLRPNLNANKALNDSYWYLAIGYFNVVLPSFFPKNGDVTRTFWHRARSAKEQSTSAAKSPMLIPRSRQMARERGVRARAWGKEDDEKARGVWVPPPPKPALHTLTTGSRQRAGGMLLFGYTFVGKLWISPRVR